MGTERRSFFTAPLGRRRIIALILLILLVVIVVASVKYGERRGEQREVVRGAARLAKLEREAKLMLQAEILKQIKIACKLRMSLEQFESMFEPIQLVDETDFVPPRPNLTYVYRHSKLDRVFFLKFTDGRLTGYNFSSAGDI